MTYELVHTTNKRFNAGSGDRLGAVLYPEGVNFALSSQHAKEVFLLLFNAPDGPPTDIIKIETKTENIWHVFVHDLKAGQLYGYKVNGDYNPKEGLRFNPHKLLIDPYTKALTGQYDYKDNLLFAYDVNAEDKDLVMDTRDNTECMPKCIVIDDAFDWQNDQKPNIPREELIVYETHVKDFTAHPSAQVKNPGTYEGFIEKIPYLKELGINAVELLPVHAFYVQDHLVSKGLTNYWGYDSIGFFAPTSIYGTRKHFGCQVQEFKTLVRELHKAGLEVILDVVYNHTGEGNQLGPTLSFKGIDNPNYYYLTQNTPEEPYRYYRNDSGCGNTFNLESPAALRLVLDSLRYWVEVMHVDGFRFDLATVLGKVNGEFSPEGQFLNAVAQDPVLQKVKMIAEPWDLTTYQVGNFPKDWGEWNGRFRDTTRKFIKGDEGQVVDMVKRLTGSMDLYGDKGREIWESINFITCHDGFTLRDLYSYNEKHNELNQEDNKDGTNDNASWNCGIEGDTDDVRILDLRKQMVKNALFTLLCSWGTPMVLSGDEIMHTKKGNNNTWCQDNEHNWLDWELTKKNGDVLEFFKKVIRFRKEWIKNVSRDQMPEIVWFDRKLQTPNWVYPKLRTLGMQMKRGEQLLFIIFNMHYRGSVMTLPAIEGKKWFQWMDTARNDADDFRSQGKERMLRRQDEHYCAGRSIVILTGK